MKFKTTYRQIFKYTSLLGGVQIFNVLMSIIRNKCAAYFIGPWGMGLADERKCPMRRRACQIGQSGATR